MLTPREAEAIISTCAKGLERFVKSGCKDAQGNAISVGNTLWLGNGMVTGMVKHEDLEYVRNVVAGKSEECSIRTLFEHLGADVAGDSALLDPEVYGDVSVRSAVEVHEGRLDTFDSTFLHGVINELALEVAKEVGESVAEGLRMWCKGGERGNRIELVRALRPLLRHLAYVVY